MILAFLCGSVQMPVILQILISKSFNRSCYRAINTQMTRLSALPSL